MRMLTAISDLHFKNLIEPQCANERYDAAGDKTVLCAWS